jgi:hypothetical protein
MRRIPMQRPAQPLTALEVFIIKQLNSLLSSYREDQEDADRTETTKYARIINDLQTLLSEIAHF